MISHIPPGDDCLHAWGQRFRALSDRYQHVIRFGLYGHTHNEAFKVTKDIRTNKNVGLSFVGGSLTSYTDKNPGFTVIEVDEELMIPLNFKTYYFNLTQANNGDPKWELYHDFKQEYDIPSVSPDSL